MENMTTNTSLTDSEIFQEFQAVLDEMTDISKVASSEAKRILLAHCIDKVMNIGNITISRIKQLRNEFKTLNEKFLNSQELLKNSQELLKEAEKNHSFVELDEVDHKNLNEYGTLTPTKIPETDADVKEILKEPDVDNSPTLLPENIATEKLATAGMVHASTVPLHQEAVKDCV